MPPGEVAAAVTLHGRDESLPYKIRSSSGIKTSTF